MRQNVAEIIWMNYLFKRYEIYTEDCRRHDALGDSILIGRIFLRLLEELEARNIQNIEFNDPVVVKRFQIIPLA
ncbi:hypothetical protein [Paenibacillus assamensis]|uniref:hypothetical protein n=1 Tax=Paenibacillus assamensis TaxID=311244 RepID=UPI001469BC10|nr:hypothetical protein [Paenibacillus assamensis]